MHGNTAPDHFAQKPMLSEKFRQDKRIGRSILRCGAVIPMIGNTQTAGRCQFAVVVVNDTGIGNSLDVILPGQHDRRLLITVRMMSGDGVSRCDNDHYRKHPYTRKNSPFHIINPVRDDTETLFPVVVFIFCLLRSIYGRPNLFPQFQLLPYDFDDSRQNRNENDRNDQHF